MSIEGMEKMNIINLFGFYIEHQSCETWVGVMANAMLTKQSA